jgi:hypothetical protein
MNANVAIGHVLGLDYQGTLCHRHYRKMELFAAQHGIKPLDGGDADAADAVELRGLIDSLPRIDPSGFPSVSHRFPLAPLQVVDDLLARLISRFRHESAENSRDLFR